MFTQLSNPTLIIRVEYKKDCLIINKKRKKIVKVRKRIKAQSKKSI